MPSITTDAIVQRDGKLVEEFVTLPALGAHQVLVKVSAAAFNPTDSTYPFLISHAGSSQGEVEGVGAYSKYCIAEERIAFKIPEGISSIEAATLPLSANTAWLGLFAKECLGLARVSAEPQYLLVWGGSSTVGSYAIQLAHVHNIQVVTTCSPRNFEAVKAAGATHVFDYNDPEVVDKIRRAVPDLSYVFDTIGNPTSSPTAAKCINVEKGALCTVMPGKTNTEGVPGNVRVTDVIVFAAILKPHIYRRTTRMPANPYMHDLSAEFFDALPRLLEDGKLRPQRVKDMGPLTGPSLEEAFEMNRNGKISNAKLCFLVSEIDSTY
ncbi:MAG: hypothetical protein M1819_002908 [Sarea resinae]|nr:MAG: hypothetical protein M1819_002908 [Sarea resinae]